MSISMHNTDATKHKYHLKQCQSVCITQMLPNTDKQHTHPNLIRLVNPTLTSQLKKQTKTTHTQKKHGITQEIDA